MASATKVRIAMLIAAAIIIPACGGGSSGGGGAAAGSLGIWALGGTGTNGDGGNGDWIEIDSYSGADLNILSSGSVNAAVSIAVNKPFLGTNQRTISADTTLTGTLGGSFIQGDAVGNATGLHVQAGTTLTLNPNRDTNNADADFNQATGTKEQVYLSFNDGIYVEGTIVINVMDGSANTSNVYWDCDDLVIAPGGRIDFGGADNLAGAGANGGTVDVYAYGVVNAGTIDGNGGNGTTAGGTAAYVYIWSYDRWLNSGTFTANGGNASAGTGGSGNDIYVSSDYGSHNNGTMTATGGTGTTSGGSGGYVELSTYQIGGVTNAGVLDASGGDCTVNGNGGGSGDVYVECNSGELRLAGTIYGIGGDGGPSGGNGGGGGDIDVQQYDDNDYISSNYAGHAAYIGAQFNSSGGNGANGGSADDIYFEFDDGYGYANRAGHWFVGYAAINGSGGNGTDDGGDGGNTLYPSYAFAMYSYWDAFDIIGNVYNNVPWTSRGGVGTSGYGGYGGDIDFEIYGDQYSNTYGEGDCSMTNVATIDVSGGNGPLGGGDGGYIYWYNESDYFEDVAGGSTNTGAWLAVGGNGSAGYGGDGGYIYTYEEDSYYGELGRADFVNSGTWNVSGGHGGSTYGGDGGGIDIYQYSYGYDVDSQAWGFINSGSFLANGGNGNTYGGDGGYFYGYGTWYYNSSTGWSAVGGNGATQYGGDGGYFNLYWYYDYPTYRSSEFYVSIGGTIDAHGGSGATTGGDGDDIYFDCYGRLTVGALHSYGGTGITGGGDGDYANGYSDWSLTLGGNILTYGGSTTSGFGGDGDDIYWYSRWITVYGSSIARGGNSTAGGGGDADYVEFYSTEIPSAFAGGVLLDARGGTGTVAGTDDGVWIDGIHLAAPFKQY